jgi:hypothetical protein
MRTPQKEKPYKDRVRSRGMIAMNQRGGDGVHGGGKRQRNRKDRQSFKRELRAGDYL